MCLHFNAHYLHVKSLLKLLNHISRKPVVLGKENQKKHEYKHHKKDIFFIIISNRERERKKKGRRRRKKNMSTSIGKTALFLFNKKLLKDNKISYCQSKKKYINNWRGVAFADLLIIFLNCKTIFFNFSFLPMHIFLHFAHWEREEKRKKIKWFNATRVK